MVAMTKKINTTLLNGTVVEDQEFNWDFKEQGYMHSSLFYGYICTQFLGGLLGSRFGGHITFGTGIAASSILILLIPIAAKTHIILFYATRILQGAVSGIVFPAVFGIWRFWAPAMERSILGTIGQTGTYIGISIGVFVSSVICDYWGWEYVFYLFGGLGLLWYCLWVVAVKASPDVDPYISQAEKMYILATTDSANDHVTAIHPWREILTSTAVHSIFAGSFTSLYIGYTISMLLPTYLNDVFNHNLVTTGSIATLPYLILVIMLFVSGYLGDRLRVKGYLSTGQVRRLFNCGAFASQMLFALFLAFTDNLIPTIIYVTILVSADSFACAGYMINGLDIAPQYASVIMGMANSFGTFGGILSPILAGYIVTDGSKEQWQVVFFIIAGIGCFGTLFCGSFTRGNLQPWAQADNKESKTVKEPLTIPL
ncbi:MFS domain-containing protein [Sergentomyia squamirostris]